MGFEKQTIPTLRAIYCTIGCCAASDMAALSLRSFQHPCPAARKLTISRYECHNQSHQKDQLEHCFTCSNITISYVVAVSHDSDNKFVDNSYTVLLCE